MTSLSSCPGGHNLSPNTSSLALCCPWWQGVECPSPLTRDQFTVLVSVPVTLPVTVPVVGPEPVPVVGPESVPVPGAVPEPDNPVSQSDPVRQTCHWASLGHGSLLQTTSTQPARIRLSWDIRRCPLRVGFCQDLALLDILGVVCYVLFLFCFAMCLTHTAMCF